ncbi:glycosyltransferase family 4 protein [Azospirillum sp. RWY-5-1]|uniref:Glycosyltransferase family 4 protein n=1 Tax=Azospirillum oleiclasticum TaxID=2735135 RepID=A0ABX2THP0_9PROT|nr:glycosyltransferase family 4 protein [Azospirillum oleiclasticum]NYZ14925.1 glycosyltransferase family 4 protein [Azospirillum oleiclasticum]NYZ22687.1 glycosyltransferase family 4 protein [Azospirillum oleiclasticum]
MYCGATQSRCGRVRSILFVNRVFPPQRGATGRCLADLSERLAAAGWRVTVLCDGDGPADAPQGVIVLRTGRSIEDDGRLSARAYLRSLARLAFGALRVPRQDVIVTMTDPPLLALSGPMLAAWHRAAVIHWCHDLYPDLLPALGVVTPRLLAGHLGRWMRRALRAHDGVVAIGRCMSERLSRMGITGARITVLPNWPDPAIHQDSGAAASARRDLGLDGRFVVTYAGNFGLAHPLGTILDAAALLARDCPEVLFLMVGDGRAHGAMVARAAEIGLGNLLTLPFQPKERIGALLGAADLHLVTMNPTVEGMLVPCKATGALATHRPCLFLGPAGSEAARRITERRCGMVLDPGDAAGLAAAIVGYRNDHQRRAEEGRRAGLAAAEWTADLAAVRFAGVIDALARNTTMPAGFEIGSRGCG